MDHSVILTPSQSPMSDSDIDRTQKHDHHENDHESPAAHSDELILNLTIATIGNHRENLRSLLDTFLATKFQAFQFEIRALSDRLGAEYTPRQRAHLLDMYGNSMEQAAVMATQRLRYDSTRLEGLSGDTPLLSERDEDEDGDEGEEHWKARLQSPLLSDDLAIQKARRHNSTSPEALNEDTDSLSSRRDEDECGDEEEEHEKASFSLPSPLLTSPSNSFHIEEASSDRSRSIEPDNPLSLSTHTEPSPTASLMLSMSPDSLLRFCTARKPSLSHIDQSESEGDEQTSTAEDKTPEHNSAKQPRRAIVIDWERFHREYCDGNESGDVADCAWCGGWREGFGQERRRPAIGRGTECFKELIAYLEEARYM